MWFLAALLSALFYALLWIFARMSRGIPVSVVVMIQHAFGPVLLLFAARTVDFPWGETWFRWYLLLPFVILPISLWSITYALHRTEVTIVKPLFGLSSIATLLIAVGFFGESVTEWGILGILVITLGLFCLYHGRWESWKRSGPWIALCVSIVFGVNVAILSKVLSRFPHILAISGLVMTSVFFLSSFVAIPALSRVSSTKRNISLLAAMALSVVAMDLFTLYAITLGPSSYVVSVKRTSVLMVAIMGYVFLRERDQSLMRLLIASGLVVLGVVFLTV